MYTTRNESENQSNRSQDSMLIVVSGRWDLHISPEEFDEVAKELAKALDYYGVPEKEKGEVLAAFAIRTK